MLLTAEHVFERRRMPLTNHTLGVPLFAERHQLTSGPRQLKSPDVLCRTSGQSISGRSRLRVEGPSADNRCQTDVKQPPANQGPTCRRRFAWRPTGEHSDMLRGISCQLGHGVIIVLPIIRIKGHDVSAKRRLGSTLVLRGRHPNQHTTNTCF